MKLLQLNAWGARLENQVADLLKKEQPDIICLQEVIDLKGDGGIFRPFEMLRQDADLEYSFHSPMFTSGFMNKSASFGNGITSRYPIKKEKTVFTNLDHVTDFSFDENDYNIRNLQHAVVEVEGKQINILNHHGHHVPGHKNGDADTIRQCKQIADYIKRLNGPIILAGDFNLSPDSESLEIINSLLTNLPKEHKLKTTRNHLTKKNEVCDYIFINDDIKLVSFKMLDDIVSDHAALTIEFEL